MLIPSFSARETVLLTSLSRRVNANSQPLWTFSQFRHKLIKKGEC